ncbi:hypothetical protein AV530_000508 [Patagioenas fasciata monilis]|uniref:Uncharacterized protein n=1 Tax=Patagioenas fasciata monilis TaxID=372326 RepID=A0A1V4IFG6_PATFA|nr:hypothetical protein AV530_000508 [Patagioenas fasciata monilis]
MHARLWGTCRSVDIGSCFDTLVRRDMATVVQSNRMLQGGRLGLSSALLGKVKQMQQNCTWVFNFLATVQPMLLLEEFFW